MFLERFLLTQRMYISIVVHLKYLKKTDYTLVNYTLVVRLLTAVKCKIVRNCQQVQSVNVQCSVFLSVLLVEKCL